MLRQCELPTDGVGPTAGASFLVAVGPDGLVAGGVGLEGVGPDLLLRSLAVAVDFRGTGLGDELLAAAERAAGVSQAQRIFLLTKTAEEFFSGRGYMAIPRRQAPNCIRSSKEFAVLCPGSAQLMVKVVATRSNDRNPNTQVH